MPEDPQKKSSIKFVERWRNSFGSAAHVDRLPHAYLFSGPAGSGKKEAAEAIAGSLLGRTENHPDLIRIAPEKTTIKIETIRELVQRISLKPLESDRLVVLIEEAESMTEGAANALLKTLEEPPPTLLFILMTAVPERLPATIRSRCQRVSFQIARDVLQERLTSFFSSWKEELSPLFESEKTSFASLSRLAESVARETDRLDSLFQLLQGLWHDAAIYRETREEGLLLLPAAIEWTRREADLRGTERLFQELDLILETEGAIEGNVNKTLALERLFGGIGKRL